MKKIIFLLLIVGFINNKSDAQRLENYNAAERKIEVLAYAATDIMPDDIYVSFVVKEYKVHDTTVSIDESVSVIKKTLLEIGANPKDLNPANIYGYVSSKEDGGSVFQHKTQYVLRLNSIEQANRFVERINKFAIESLSIDEINAKIPDLLIRNLQNKAFADAREKANLFLNIYDEKVGKLLELVEVNGNFSYPTSNGEGKTRKSIKVSDGIQYYETRSENSKSIKFEYVAKVIFEIK